MKKILVVDDEFDLLETICATLEMGGYEPIRAGNGREALEIVEGAQPDLVLTDVMMPYVSGYELVAALRKKSQCQDVPAVIMSAIDVSQHPEGTWIAVLKKPFTFETLLGTVEKIVGK
ncbi:response regulator [Ramlibacter sp.]|uniref:response regulator n=1 Tax=Ramlibacter sp. TaxID=1917967 RepID=UPI003D0B9173